MTRNLILVRSSIWATFLILVLYIPKITASNKLELQQLFSDKGLPGSIVSCIYQDNYGYMWFGIESSGIYRFDGINMLNYQHNPSDTNSLINNFVNVITEDSEKNIWIGTTGGLDVKIQSQDNFRHLLTSKPFKDLKVNTLLQDANNNILAGTNSGLFRFKNYTDYPHKIEINSIDRSTININDEDIAIRALFEDSENILWVGTSVGLFMKQANSDQLYYCGVNTPQYRSINITSITSKNTHELIIGSYEGVFIYDIQTDHLKRVLFPRSSIYNRGKAGIRKIVVDNKNRWWIASMQYGLICVKPSRDIYQINENDVIQVEGISTSTITDIYIDKNENVWVSSKYEGLFIYDKRLQIFEGVTLQKPNSANDEYFVMALCEDKSGKLWAGTRASGLYYYDSFSNVPKPFFLPKNLPYQPRRIESLYTDSNNNLWIGTNKGFFKYSLTTRKSSYYQGNSVWTFLEDNQKRIWIGTETGIYIYNDSINTYQRYQNSKHQDFFNSEASVGIIQQVSDGTIWFGALFDGLFSYNPVTDSLVYFVSTPEDSNGISDNSIRSFYEDASHNLWIGTRSQGLNKYNPNTKRNEVFMKSDGLASNAIYHILPDRNNHIWLGTDMGLVKFDIKDNSVTNYNQKYGLPTTVFEPRSGTVLSDGRIAFGYHNGVILFNPDSIHRYSTKNNLIISSISIKGSKKKLNINKNDTLILKYNENFLTFDFALLDYALASKNQYKYILEGLDENWQEPTNRNYVTYTNLEPGIYKFKLLAVNYQNDWSSKPLQLLIEIKPPFWKTNYAYITYFVLIIFLFIIFYWFVKNQTDLKHKILAVQKETQKTIEIEEAKIEFFTNIAHEFQTPLTLILAPIEKLEKLLNNNKEARHYLHMIQKSSDQLLKLIEQLLFFRKVQSGVGQLNTSVENINTLTERCIHQYHELALQKNITINFITETKYPQIRLDVDKIEKVISNLIMNSIKYSYTFGKIDVSISDDQLNVETIERQLRIFNKVSVKSEPFVKISIKDDGKGMTKHESENIFKRYFQYNKEGIGAGIGLDLAKTLTELHRGQIQCISEKNVGSEFIIWLPVNDIKGQNAVSIHEPGKLKADLQIKKLPDHSMQNKNKAEEHTYEDSKNKQVILIIDDNKDLLDFLEKNLSGKYKVLIAEDGLKGYDLASNHVPDVIISDVVMPGMDGIQLCKKVKEDITTCHIPFIMLTTKNTIEDKLEIVETGADEYIAKPFNLNYLELKISGLIKLRDNIQKQILSNGTKLDSVPKDITVYDKNLLKNINQIIIKNISDSDFSVEQLSNEIGMSRAQLNRKLKALMDQSPMELIYTIRLEEAKRLLTSNNSSISEVARITGFKSPSSFSTVFKNKYGYPPSNINK